MVGFVCFCCVLMQMTKKVLCMNPGPIEFEQRVLKEFSAEGISHVDKTVIEVFGQALEKMRKVRILLMLLNNRNTRRCVYQFA